MKLPDGHEALSSKTRDDADLFRLPDSLLARLWHFCRRSVEITNGALKSGPDPKHEVTLSEAAGRRAGELKRR